MEADPPLASPSTSLSSRLRQQVLARRENSVRDQKARLGRTPPRLGKDGEKVTLPFGLTSAAAARLRIRPSPGGALPKSLLPVTERRSQEENSPIRRNKTGSQEEDKWELTPDGGSAGREGRNFAVANVGNNGRIYLRPTVRPANQRYPQPNFVFPMTPPSTAGLDALTLEKGRETDETTLFHETQWTPTPSGSSPSSPKRELLYAKGGNGLNLRGHRRAMSDSTVPDTSVARESEPGGFKIVITQHGDDQRPKTVDAGDAGRTPLLEVAIPSWRIGTPRFSVRGTPFIRGSSYAPTEEFRSSNVSFLHQYTPQDGSPNGFLRPSPVPVPIPELEPLGAVSDSSDLNGFRITHPLRSTYMSTHLVIEPAMFDALTFKPACDERSIVRYSAAGAVTAATPPRLVAEITSPSFLDYDLISDFFLTYRSFLDPTDLLYMMLARLRWSLERSDEAGLIVRVRTFVAIRHWILNYFVDDFVVDYNIRVVFCNLLNDIVSDLSDDVGGRKVQLKILAELKKCWRRVCAQYWDGPDFDSSAGPDIPIAPGGIAGHRNPGLDPSFWVKADVGPPQLDGLGLPTSSRETSFYADVSRAGHIDSIIVGDRPGTPENPPARASEPERNQTSPTSITSVDVISCSFPTKNMRFAQPGANYPLAAHPVDPSSVYNNTELVATTPRALVGKRVRPQHAHKRNGSLSDSMREPPSTTEKVLFRNAEFLLTLPYAGSLVRGNLFPPSQAFVEVVPPNGPGGQMRQTTLFQPQTSQINKEKLAASAMSGQGMRKLLGSVRRALSTRGQGVSPTQGNFINISPIGPRGATINRLPGTAIVPQARHRQNGIRPPVRIDLLGAEIAEDFKKAVREDAAAEAGKYGYLSPPVVGSSVPGELLEYSVAHMDTTYAFDNTHVRPSSDMGITTGSKSIVIVDDTLLPDDYPMMTGALPVNSSVEAFAETFMTNTADPTPPNTPPGRAIGTPRRSSYILSHHVLRSSSLSADTLPPFVPDMETLGSGVRPSQDSFRPSQDSFRPSFEFGHKSLDKARPPLSGVRGHVRHGSSRSYISSRSVHHRRHASFTSGIMPPTTIRSFDATTYSEGSLDGSSHVLVPQPLRVLRRRPGGDLRAATNVGDLDHLPLRRSRSVGSLTTYTDSVRSSFLRSPALESSGYVDVVTSDYSPNREETFSLGAIAEQNPKQNLSLFSTHSSKPIMRPSFEAEAQKLAQIPDDVDDDGGVESALLKLEGRYERRVAKLSMDLKSPLSVEVIPDADLTGFEGSSVPVQEKKEHRHVHIGEDPHAPISTAGPPSSGLDGSFLDVTSRHGHNEDVQSFLSEDSASYSSTPLLERGFTDDGHSKRTVTREWTDRSILQGPDEGGNTPDDRSQHASYEFINKTDSMDKIQAGSTMPAAEPCVSVDQSFLDVGSDNDTDLSSELSAEDLEFLGQDPGVISPTDIGLAVSTSLPSHPLAESRPGLQILQQSSTDPPSPPITLIQALNMAPEAGDDFHDAEGWHEKPLPPTPDTTPTTAGAPYAHYPLSSPDPTGTKEALRNAPRFEIPDPVVDQAELPRNNFSVHLPFILAFDSDILAQQFTLIEKDALNEIDWKELIDMRWKNAEQNGINSRSWVSFLRDTDARGVEVVIARFNIMVKWAISEIVLTQDLEERARCIIKLIHIATHCRRYRNFATMSQLAIALTSNEVGRLTKTWAMVSPADQKTMHDLEALISPTRNFYSLRSEMEGGGAAGAAAIEMGCIPFVGIYTHDLLFNAQRPSEIASSPTTAPLVNFERCRTSAGVVKTLLRLLEASTLYTFQPIEGITERCLWMGALTDEEIRKLGESLE